MEAKTKKQPAYLALYEHLRAAIITGDYPYGGRMPSKRQLAEETGRSLVTVEHALSLLCDEGYLEARERSGHYVSFRQDEGFLPAAAAPLRTGPKPKPEGETFPFSILARTMRRVISDHGETLLERCPPGGCAELRSALSRYLGRARGIHAAPEQIYIGSGAEYLYGLIVQALGRDRLYALEDPSYEKIRQVYEANGAATVLLPLRFDGVDSAALAATKADVLHITPYRSFPSDVTASAAKRREYVRWASVPGRVIVEDDFTSELSAPLRPEETVFSLDKRGSVIYLNTFSRTVAPSLRMGYLVLSRPMAALFEEKVGFYSCTVPVFEQYALAELIDSGDYERHLRRVRRQRRRQG